MKKAIECYRNVESKPQDDNHCIHLVSNSMTIFMDGHMYLRHSTPIWQ